MKRYAISFVLLVSAFACSRGPVASAPVKKPIPATAAEAVGTTTIELAADDVIELNEDQSDAADDLVHTVPTGSFASVASFCDAQTKLVASKLVEVNANAHSSLSCEPISSGKDSGKPQADEQDLQPGKFQVRPARPRQKRLPLRHAHERETGVASGVSATIRGPNHCRQYCRIYPGCCLSGGDNRGR